MLAIESPYPQFFELDGRPLDAGYVYVGAENQNPETSPITVYWDSALTQPAAQPLRTKNGMIARSGTPAFVFAATNHSMTVRSSTKVQVLYAKSSQEFSVASLINGLRSDLLAVGTGKGANMVSFQQDGYNAVVRTMLAKAREIVSADDFPSLQEAANAAAGKTLRLTPGKTYTVVDSLAFTSPNTHIEGYGATILYPKPSANYFHCIRATEDGFQARGLRIVMQGSGLVRGDSGFGICVFNDTKHIKGTIIQDCHVSGIASAGMWLQNVSEVIVTKNTVKNCLADGIHIADGASQIIVSNNICLDNADDNIALVNDVAGSPYVTGFTITGNYVNCANVSHGGGGIVLIGAVSGVVSSNTLEATYGGGIHMYQWVDEFKTDKVLISGNKFTATGRASGSGSEATGGLGILLQLTAGVQIVGNDFSDIGYNAAAPSNGAVWIADGKNVSITANNFQNIACDAVNALTSGPITGGMILTVNANVFGYVARNAVNLGPVVDLAAATVKDNIFQSTAGTHDIYLDKPTATMIVQGNSCKKLVYVNGNSTSLLSRIEVESFAPVIGAAGGAITSSNATMVYQRMGKFVLVSLTVEIINNGTGAGVITVSLPFPVVSGSLSGRETVVTGVSVMGLMNAGVLQLRRYDNGYPGANGAVLVLSGLLVLP
jgi:parallel beta-helix repeat protein